MVIADASSTTCSENQVRMALSTSSHELICIVDLEAYPDYLDSVGGEDKMMDFSTMQAKADNEEYRGIEDFQVGHSHAAPAGEHPVLTDRPICRH